MVHNYTESIVDGRPSSRVLAQPGGKSDMASILAMGGAPEPAKPAPRTANPVAPSMPGDAPVAGQRVAVRTEHGGITDVPSSRVLAAPGGRSDMGSIIFGGGDAAPATQPVRKMEAPVAPVAPVANVAPAAGQRVAVRTEHGGITEVSSSRVLAAPGGKSDMASIIGGGGGADDRKAALMARRAQATAMHPTTNVNGM